MKNYWNNLKGELRKESVDRLNSRISEINGQLFNVKRNKSKDKKLKKTIAVIKTIINEMNKNEKRN